jgi:hypothetical protein
MKRFLYALAGLAVFGVIGLGQADPNQACVITPEVGAWTICAASFTGELAPQLARDLVMELRSQYHLHAYLYNRGAEQRRQQQQEIEEQRRQKKEYLRQNGIDPANVHLPVRTVRIEEQYVVLVGGFKDMETGRKELERIKKLQPPRSVPKDTLYRVSLPNELNRDQKQQEQKTEVNPFRNSFVVPNPTIPMGREPTNKPDPFWKELNAGESYSLLKCPKPWTLAVKEYQGATVLQAQHTPTNFLEKLFSRSADQLSASALNAHNMAEALHRCGFDAYVLHTRTSSIVTIGEFDGPRDPRMEAVKQAFFASQPKIKFASNDSRFPQGIDLFAQPRPMEVPRP